MTGKYILQQRDFGWRAAWEHAWQPAPYHSRHRHDGWIHHLVRRVCARWLDPRYRCCRRRWGRGGGREWRRLPHARRRRIWRWWGMAAIARVDPTATAFPHMAAAADLKVVRHGTRRPRGSDGDRPPLTWRRRIWWWGGMGAVDLALEMGAGRTQRQRPRGGRLFFGFFRFFILRADDISTHTQK